MKIIGYEKFIVAPRWGGFLKIITDEGIVGWGGAELRRAHSYGSYLCR